ncbi:enolase-phosphatase E1-like [Branchiostoma lanceolatum]|uniref:enolase-phosphatase E1-like n=1 Tax=Branchiostoma lanceolatum TaxID=7740 RepID=UPI00345251F7
MEQPWALTQRAVDTSAETTQQVAIEKSDAVAAHHADQGSTADVEVTSTKSSQAEKNVQAPEIEASPSPVGPNMEADETYQGEPGGQTVNLEGMREGENARSDDVREDGQSESDTNSMNAEEPKAGEAKIEASVNAEEMKDGEANESSNHPISSEEPKVGGTEDGENVSADERESDTNNDSTSNSAGTNHFQTDEEKEEESAISNETEGDGHRVPNIRCTHTEELLSTENERSLNFANTDTGRDQNEPDGQNEQGDERAKFEATAHENEARDQHAAAAIREEMEVEQEMDTEGTDACAVGTEDAPEEEEDDVEELDNILDGLLRDTAIVEDDNVATAPQKTLLVEANGRQGAAERREDGVKDRQERAAQQAEWNALPGTVLTAPTVESFRARLEDISAKKMEETEPPVRTQRSASATERETAVVKPTSRPNSVTVKSTPNGDASRGEPEGSPPSPTPEVQKVEAEELGKPEESPATETEAPTEVPVTEPEAKPEDAPEQGKSEADAQEEQPGTKVASQTDTQDQTASQKESGENQIANQETDREAEPVEGEVANQEGDRKVEPANQKELGEGEVANQVPDQSANDKAKEVGSDIEGKDEIATEKVEEEEGSDIAKSSEEQKGAKPTGKGSDEVIDQMIEHIMKSGPPSETALKSEEDQPSKASVEINQSETEVDKQLLEVRQKLQKVASDREIEAAEQKAAQKKNGNKSASETSVKSVGAGLKSSKTSVGGKKSQKSSATKLASASTSKSSFHRVLSKLSLKKSSSSQSRKSLTSPKVSSGLEIRSVTSQSLEEIERKDSKVASVMTIEEAIGDESEKNVEKNSSQDIFEVSGQTGDGEKSSAVAQAASAEQEEDSLDFADEKRMKEVVDRRGTVVMNIGTNMCMVIEGCESNPDPELNDMNVPIVQEDESSKPAEETAEPTPEAAPEAAEAAPEPAETAPEPTETAPEPAETAPEPAETAPEPAETAPEPAEAAPEPAETAPEPAEAAPEPAETAPEEPPAAEEPKPEETPAQVGA